MVLTTRSLGLGALFLARLAKADHPYGWEPAVSLRDGSSEPDGNGWCPDIEGFGDRLNCAGTMQTHSCKPEADDTQFAYDSSSKAIFSPVYEAGEACELASEGVGGCVAVDGTIEEGASLTMSECDGSPEQSFVYTRTGYFRISTDGTKDYDLCLGSGEAISPAGIYWKRVLVLVACESADDELITWDVEPSPRSMMNDRRCKWTSKCRFGREWWWW